ncbi:MAG: sugar kinase [Capsulimonadaceae bacterium]|nr:sugar kinase [Capsulimonadaceae bacterium]
MLRVACLGILVADVVGKTIESFPPKGTLAEVERIQLHSGGCAANTSIALARLGIKASVLGKVGRDGFGDFLVNSLGAAELDASGVARSRTASTSATMVAVDAAGERTFLHYTGANAEFSEEDVDWQVIEKADILHIAGPSLMPRFAGEDCARVLARAQSMGKITTLDTVWDHSGNWFDHYVPCLPHLDYALPSLEEGRRITGLQAPPDIAKFMIDHGVGVAGIKLGEKGAYVLTSSGEELCAPPLPVTAVDALGAGDAWAAGFLCGLCHAWPLERTLRFANAVGACCVQELGATTGIRTLAETEAFLKGFENA